MGEFTGYGTPFDKAVTDRNTSVSGTGENQETGYPTDVEDVNADDVIKKGKEEYPVFNVSQDEFWSNMKADRKRLRFKNGSKAQQYMRRTRNGARPFYIKTHDQNGKEYVRKVR